MCFCLAPQDAEEEADETTVSTAESQKRKRTRTTPDDPYEFDATSSQVETASGSTTKRSKKATQDSAASQGSSLGTDSVPMDSITEDATPASISEERFNLFKKSLTQLFRESRAQSLPSSRFREYLVEQHSSQPFREHETRAAFERMTDANQIMVADDIIFLI